MGQNSCVYIIFITILPLIFYIYNASIHIFVITVVNVFCCVPYVKYHENAIFPNIRF
jgi:hypothetical protein